MIQFLWTLAIGFAVGFVFYKIKVPGGMMVGSIIGVSAFNIISGQAYMPEAAQQISKIIAGAFIGCSVSREDLLQLRYIYKPAAAMLSALLALSLLMGFIIYKLTALDLLTALLCAVPGGISELPLIANDMGADPAKVAVMQFARMVVGLGFFPSFIVWVNRMHKHSPKGVIENADTLSATKETPGQGENTEAKLYKPFFTAVACAAGCGVVGLLLPIPSGELLLSLLGTLVLKLLRIPIYLPSSVRKLAQLLAGAYIGHATIYQDLIDLKQLALPIAIMLVGYLLNSYLSGRMLQRFFGLTLKQGMLATSPAGASDIALISADIGAQNVNVTVLQVLRMLMAISVFPYIMQFVAGMFGG